MPNRTFLPIDNYIYLYHLDKFILIPVYPDQVADSMSATFTSTDLLSRSAPIFAYSYSGPRTVQIQLKLHREMMTVVNEGVSEIALLGTDDYVDTLIKHLQTMVVPKYSDTNRMVNPPLVALRIGNEIFIKGVVTQGVSITYELPLLQDLKYAVVNLSFTVSEILPFDASEIGELGSFRGMNKTLERRILTLQESIAPAARVSLEDEFYKNNARNIHGGGGDKIPRQHGGGGGSFTYSGFSASGNF